MGLTKNYLKFVHDSTFGVVAASQVGASIRYLQMRNTKDRYIAVPACENVYFWDQKTKQVINQLNYDADNASEVTVFECFHGGHPRTNLIAVGYANGRIRVFEYETGTLKSTFTGHRTSISALAFDKTGSRLASGGKDCTIVVWDIAGEEGLFSLKGHKNAISKLVFLHNEDHQKDLIVSSSLDPVSTLKFWDLQTQHCFCTVPGNASGVWSFIIIKNGTRLIAGTPGAELRVYSLEFISADEQSIIEDDSSETEFGLRVKHLGNILRNSSAISNRVQDILCDKEETVIICHSIDRNVEFYGIRTVEEVALYAKKKAKKAARRIAKRKTMEDRDGDGEESYEPAIGPQHIVDCEYNRKLGFRRLNDKIRAVTVTKSGEKFKLAAMLSSNKVESFLVSPHSEDIEQISKIDYMSHRNDVRSIAISQDNSTIMSASNESLKIWLIDCLSCIATIDTENVTCCVFANAENFTRNCENRFALLGTKTGSLQIVDLAESRIVDTIDVCNESKSLNSIFVQPNKNGIVCGGEDGMARFYNYVWRDHLSLEEDRTFSFQESITCVKISFNNKLLAVALLDSTVRIHYVDTFKYFLTLYGHKFPVTTMDISDDNTLLATGSPDKNIKIWGLDFGDCHKSIFAHDDAITGVHFVPKTHQIFSCGRDRSIKHWDGDRFIKIQTLRGHQAEIWCLSVSPNGKYLVTGSHDRSLRVYRKTEEILVPSEEDETQRELEDERNVFEKQENIVVGETNAETGFASKMTIETVKSTDKLIEAIDVFELEQHKMHEYLERCEIADRKGEARPPEPEKDPLLMTALTTDHKRFMLEILRRIRSSELEEILLTLPFNYVRKLLEILATFLDRLWDVELMIRCATFLLKVNFGQVAACPALIPIVHKLRAVALEPSHNLRDRAGFNLTALEHLNLARQDLAAFS